MKRAIDLSLKHTYLAHDVQKVEGTPYASYLEINEVQPHVALICAAHSASSSAARFLRCPPSHVAAGAQGPAGAPREQVDAARAVNTYIFSNAASCSCLDPLQACPAVHQHECLLSLLGRVLHLACRRHHAGGIAQQRIHVVQSIIWGAFLLVLLLPSCAPVLMLRFVVNFIRQAADTAEFHT